MTDYRVVDNKNPLNNIDDKKKEFQKIFESKHPKAKDYYKYINKIDSELNKNFANIYGKRCAYCGIDYNIKNLENFVVDHFICQASGEDYINHLSNLIYACDYCNKIKSNFKISKEDSIILHPDQELGKTFYRDEMFRIKISKTYEDNDSVKNFHSRMKFDHERRRLEYLILVINEWLSTTQDKDERYNLLEISKILINCYNAKTLK